MKSAISRLNQSGLQLDDEAVRTIQAASRPDWNPNEQLVLVTIPDVSVHTTPATGVEQNATAKGSKFESIQSSIAMQAANVRFDLPASAVVLSAVSPKVGPDEPSVSTAVRQAEQDSSRSRSSSVPVEVESGTEAAGRGESTKIRASFGENQSFGERHANSSDKLLNKNHSAVVESLVSRFGSDKSCLIHFCDTDQPPRAAEICFSAAIEFAKRTQRRVLLLDLSRSTRPLSSLMGVDLAAGFHEVLRTELDWRKLARQTSYSHVDVLPAGVIKLNTTARLADFEYQVRSLVSELTAQYGGVFSCADTAFDLESELIGLCSDGGFLTMDFHRTSRGLAKTAAYQLRASGTRLLGCIAAVSGDQVS